MNSLSPIDDVNIKTFDEICEERFSNIDLDCLLVSVIDNVPSDALPHLAEQYHITGNEGWLQVLNDNEKRNLIKSSILMHRYKGTKFALKEVFKTLDITGEILEWFDYGGEPYYFKVRLYVSNRSISEETELKLRALINEYKNERSWLQDLEVYLNASSDITFCSYYVLEETLTINCRE